MKMTIDTIINDCEQRIKQNELFIKVHQKNMEIGEIKEYQYYIERDKLTIDTMRKYQKIRDKISTIYVGYRHGYEVMADVMEILREVEDGNNN